MVEFGYAPPACEMKELRRLAVEKCDNLDGVKDGLVLEPERCFAAFDPRSHIGDQFVCDEAGGKTLKITEAGIQVAKMALAGEEGAELSKSPFAWTATMCDYSKNSSDGAAAEVPRCKPNPWAYAMPWVQYFLLRDPAKPLDRTSCFQSRLPDVARLVHQSRQWYTSLVGTFDPDLSALRDGGGKLLLLHGMADEAIPLNNSRNYYDAVAARDPDRVDGYLRYFEAPGVSHCGIGGEGNGLYPVRMLDVLRAWVEQGVAPDSVPAAVRAADPATGGRMTRNLCRFPRKAKYDGVGNVKDAASFKCV
ncbi:hypothetical protein PG988_002208 [Apiospora saccharicola]